MIIFDNATIQNMVPTQIFVNPHHPPHVRVSDDDKKIPRISGAYKMFFGHDMTFLSQDPIKRKETHREKKYSQFLT